MNVSRRALIIGNNTGHEAPTFLHGVNVDLDNYRNYLQSDIGGSWLPGEIRILQNKSRAEILAAVRQCQADYTFVVFTGHGYVWSNDNSTYACVSDNNVCEHELDTRCYRRTLIMDCCREITTLSEGRHFNAVGDVSYFDKSEGIGRRISNSRIKFNNALTQSRMGHFTGYACEVDELSGDNPNSGGLFSSALIRAGLRFGSVDNSRGDWLPILPALRMAAKELTSDFSTQNPSYSTNIPDHFLTHPFAVTNKMRQLW